MIATLLLFLALVLGAVQDIRKREIPDTVHLLLLASGLFRIFLYGGAWLNRVVGFLLIGVLMLAVSLIQNGLGGGDVKEVASITFAMGFLPASLSFLLSFLLAGIGSLIASAVNKKTTAIPLAPFLAVGCVAVFVLAKCLPNPFQLLMT